MLVRTNIKIIVFSLHVSYSPIKDILMFILNAFIMFCLLLGKITLENICHLVALKLFNNII